MRNTVLRLREWYGPRRGRHGQLLHARYKANVVMWKQLAGGSAEIPPPKPSASGDSREARELGAEQMLVLPDERASGVLGNGESAGAVEPG